MGACKQSRTRAPTPSPLPPPPSIPTQLIPTQEFETPYEQDLFVEKFVKVVVLLGKQANLCSFKQLFFHFKRWLRLKIWPHCSLFKNLFILDWWSSTTLTWITPNILSIPLCKGSKLLLILPLLVRSSEFLPPRSRLITRSCSPNLLRVFIFLQPS